MYPNGTARAYMAKGMEEKEFLNHVVNTMERVCNEWRETVCISANWDSAEERVTIIYSLKQQKYSLNITKDMINHFQTKGPYVLDRFLWERLMASGVEVKEDPYLDIVFNS